ncbi:MAG: precorrin-2 C(20)-methyltransferase [Rhodocyclaceae bacterium]
MTSTCGRLIGVSLGPGDPDLITRSGWAVLNGSARWAYPVRRLGGDSYALDIVRRGGLAVPEDAVALVFPMTSQPDLLVRAWADAAAQALAVLREGRDLAFLVEGDASTYSTFGHLSRCLRELEPGVKVDVLPGVTSYCAAAAAVGQPLADTDDTLAVIPSAYGIGVIEHLLDEFDTLVLLKVKPLLDDVLALLERRGLVAEAVFVEKVGTPEERIVDDVRTLAGEKVEYLSLMMIRNPQRRRPSQLQRGCGGRAPLAAVA